MALGASGREVAMLFVRRGLVLSTIGLALGLVLAMAAGRALAGALEGIPAPDAPMLAIIAVVLGGATLVACSLPVRRVRRVDPTAILRQS